MPVGVGQGRPCSTPSLCQDLSVWGGGEVGNGGEEGVEKQLAVSITACICRACGDTAACLATLPCFPLLVMVCLLCSLQDWLLQKLQHAAWYLQGAARMKRCALT